jgi:hypothetical protein
VSAYVRVGLCRPKRLIRRSLLLSPLGLFGAPEHTPAALPSAARVCPGRGFFFLWLRLPRGDKAEPSTKPAGAREQARLVDYCGRASELGCVAERKPNYFAASASSAAVLPWCFPEG